MDAIEQAENTLGWIADVAELAGRQEGYSVEAYGVILGLYAVAAQLAAVREELRRSREELLGGKEVADENA